jgi:tetratricopeptide (TPR) repeat protein
MTNIMDEPCPTCNYGLGSTPGYVSCAHCDRGKIEEEYDYFPDVPEESDLMLGKMYWFQADESLMPFALFSLIGVDNRHFRLRSIMKDIKLYEQPLHYLEEAIKATPERKIAVRCYKHKVRILNACGHYTEALEACEALLKIEPSIDIQKLRTEILDKLKQ